MAKKSKKNSSSASNSAKKANTEFAEEMCNHESTK